MKRARVIPVLLVQGAGLVKTIRFKDGKYVGDPINAIHIFNEKEVDELVVLDITATEEKRPPRFERVQDWASECFMPLCYGGGITQVKEMERLFLSGIEKVAINTAAADHLELIRDASRLFGSQSIVVSMDVKKSRLGRYQVVVNRASRVVSHNIVEYARKARDLGAGEILLNAVDHDGTMQGFDLRLIQSIIDEIDIPVIALGGGGTNDHLREALGAGASAVAAGSMFVFHGKHRAVLITYPDPSELSTMNRRD
jgi:cyclase